MPTRLIREGILESPRIEQLTELAELFYRRLMSVADDYGRYHAHPTRLRSNCYPTRIDRYTDDQVRGWRDECQRAGLLVVYRVAGLDYLELSDWRQQVKAKSKFPAPDDPRARSAPPPGGGPADPGNPPVIDPCTGGVRPGTDPQSTVEGVVVVEGVGGVVTRAGADARVDAPERARARTIPKVPSSWGEWASWWQQVRGIETTVRDRGAFVPLATRWITAKVTVEQMRRALETAESGATDPIAYLPAYVDRVLARSQAPPVVTAQDRQAEQLAQMTGGMHGRPATEPRTIDVDTETAPARAAIGSD